DLPQDRAVLLQKEQLELHEHGNAFEGAIGHDGSYHRADPTRPHDRGKPPRLGIEVLRSTRVEDGRLRRHLQR
ncbi:unnamed protein product, partial [Ectocarpus sp. 13 AM-2016]